MVAVPTSLWGTPTISIPVGFNAAGLPMGMQVIGRTKDDLGVLQIASAYDSATRWPERHLPKWNETGRSETYLHGRIAKFRALS